MKLGEFIKAFRTQHNLSLRKFADMCDLSKSYIDTLEKDDTIEPTWTTIKKIANATHTDVNDLIDTLDGEQRIDLSDIENLVQTVPTKVIPVLGRIACGSPVFAAENYEGYIAIDINQVRADFSLIAKGDSMVDSNINSGDIVFIKKTCQIENGQIAAVLIDNEATLKQFYKSDNAIILQPANPNYDPIVINDGDCKDVLILGKCVGVLKKFWNSDE